MAKFYSLQFGSGDPRVFTGLNPTLLIFVRMTDGATIAPPAVTESLTGSGIYQFSFGVTQPISFLADAATTSPGTAGRYVVGQIDPADRIDEVGTTLVAIGLSNIALGVTNVALGTSNIALGLTNIALGTTNIAIGTTNLGYGLTNVGLGITNAGFGSTNFALGTSIYALEQAIASTLTAIGNTVSVIGPSLYALIGTTASLIGDNITYPSSLFGYVKRVNELIQGQETFTKGTGVLNMYESTGTTLLASRTITNSASTVIKT